MGNKPNLIVRYRCTHVHFRPHRPHDPVQSLPNRWEPVRKPWEPVLPVRAGSGSGQPVQILNLNLN
jgi:hypothetical protein